MSVRLFVGNLPYDTTEADLREFFSPIGSLSTVIIPADRETGKPRGFAFVELDDPAQAEEASLRLNNQLFKGRNITINEARAKGNHPHAGPHTGSGYNTMRTADAKRSQRSGFSPRPSSGILNFDPDPSENERITRAERRQRNFGPDARPARKRKLQQGSRGEMGWKKGRIRERVGGQFFGSYEDDLYEDDQDLDYMAAFRDSDEEDAV
jgi:RNA recognition motif-containing protein